jgi:hypothetical protein
LYRISAGLAIGDSAFRICHSWNAGPLPSMTATNGLAPC